ncbi:MAG: hypothetical protein D6743_11865 [Calditrichaeota bacterium]|nr:MAG: hypothetical protein D6743_11865 [Calditrichota bacterium]
MTTRSGLILLILVGLVALAFSPEDDDQPLNYSDLRLTQIAGKKLFVLKKCADCHTLASKAQGKLTPVTNKRDDAWFKQHVQKESPIVLRRATTSRRKRRVLKEELAALKDFLYGSTVRERVRIAEMPENIFEGAYLSYQNGCIKCHTIAGAGKDVGPDLTHIADKRGDKAWHIANLKDPQQFHSDSPMPKFGGLGDEKLSLIADYLLTLRKPAK